MKSLLLATALALTATPAMAEGVELMCNGTIVRDEKLGLHSAMEGMHILVGKDTVVISGGNHLKPVTYAIDREESDAANLIFSSGRWFGILNRYSGELALMPEHEPDGTQFKGYVSATCAKADPLF